MEITSALQDTTAAVMSVAGLAVAASVDLPDLVRLVPTVLELLPGRSLGPLLSTNTRLPQLVQEFVTRIKLPHGGGPTLADLELVAAITWPRLQALQVQDARYQLEWWPPSKDWMSLKHLNLHLSNLNATGMQQLRARPLPHLLSFELSWGHLDTARITQLTKPDWPLLTSLDLYGNNLDEAALQQLCGASWPRLQKLNLGWNNLGPAAMSWLVNANWPILQSLDLGNNQLTATGLEILLTGPWTLLEDLKMNENYIQDIQMPEVQTRHFVGSVALEQKGQACVPRLARGCWPNMTHLSMERCCLDAAALEWLAWADWPQLKSLNLDYGGRDPASAQQLVRGAWPLLRELSCYNFGTS